MTRPRRFRDFTFEIVADDPALAAYFDRLYRGFEPVDDRATGVHRYDVITEADGGGRFEVDGVVSSMGGDAGQMVGSLVHRLARDLLHATDALGIHAGGVHRDGIGVALPAPMESGKSTLTTGLVRAGFDYLSDEAVLLEWHDATAFPFPKPISLDPGAWDLFPELEPVVALADDGYKRTQWQVAPSDIRADIVGPACPIRHVVFPRYSPGATTRLTPISRAEGTIELAKNTFRFNERARRSLDVLAVAVREADVFWLEIGDLDTAVALVSDLVARGR